VQRGSLCVAQLLVFFEGTAVALMKETRIRHEEPVHPVVETDRAFIP
jgi:hypothetical protein